MNEFTLIREVLTPTDVNDILQTLDKLLVMQMRKCGYASLEQFQRDDLPAFLEATKMLRHTRIGHHIAERVIRIVYEAGELETIICSGPAILWNAPKDDRSLYTWHIERHWYPKRRNFVNVWIPLTAKTVENGTMEILEGSSKRSYDFAEYYDREECYLQYEVPECEVQGIPTPIIANAGDMVVFSPDVLHRSTRNTSSLPSIAMTFRVFDYSQDLTISADWAERPYRTPEKSPVTGRRNFVTL